MHELTKVETLYRIDTETLLGSSDLSEQIQRLSCHTENPILTLYTSHSVVFLDQRSLTMNKYELEAP